MRIRFGCLLLGLLCAAKFSWAAGDDSPVQVAQKLFDGMKAHDATALTALFLPGGTIASIDLTHKIVVTPFEKFVERISGSKSQMLERMWNPKVMEHGSMAVVWGDYDFHLDGKFSHCGIDTFTMFKTESGWKLTSVSFTRENSGCEPSPLGTPAAQ